MPLTKEEEHKLALKLQKNLTDIRKLIENCKNPQVRKLVNLLPASPNHTRKHKYITQPPPLKKLQTELQKLQKQTQNDIALPPLLHTINKKIQEIKKITNTFITHNIALVRSIAFNTMKNLESKHININDLIQEGLIALIIAVYNYNPKLNTKFSTYATYWIKLKITKYIMKNFNILSIPHHIWGLKNKLYKELNHIMDPINHHIYKMNDNHEEIIKNIQE